MKSNEVFIHFPLIKIEKSLSYLKELHYSFLIYGFFDLTEDEMATYEYPSSISEIRERIDNSRYPNLADIKEFNTFLNALGLVIACARINVAINSFYEKCKEKELKSIQKLGIRRFNDIYGSSIYSDLYFKDDENDFIKIKNAAYDANERLLNWSKKNNIDGFENDFIDTIKYQIFVICHRLHIETRSITEIVGEKMLNLFIYIIFFILFCVAFSFVAKCATGNL